MKNYKLNEISDKRILGRNVKDAENLSTLSLFWGASALEICVKAAEVWVNLSSNFDNAESWVCIEVNGMQISRFMAPKEKTWICIARNLNPEKENLISIIKDTQAMSSDSHHSLFINEIGLDDSGKFVKIPGRKLKIEFIGDSITSGEGLAGGIDEWEWIPQWFCASKTYALQTAKALNADWSVVSQCGWGICWGWDGNLHNAIPPHYENVCSVMRGDFQEKLGVNQKYDFGKGSDFVVINLGTNDNGAFFQPAWKDENGIEHVLHTKSDKVASSEDGQKIYDGVKSFLKNIRHHNPNAKIIWCWGMIRLETIPVFIKKAIDDFSVENDDKKVFSLELDSMEDVEKLPEDKGSRGHPGPKTHKLAFQKLYDFLKNL